MDDPKMIVLTDNRSCRCDMCALPCRSGPENLTHGDAEKMHAAHKPEQPFAEWAKEHLTEAPPMTLTTSFKLKQTLPLILPKQTEGGECVFYKNGRCSIYAARPQGCREFNGHSSGARLRSLVSVEAYKRLTAPEEDEAAYVALAQSLDSMEKDPRYKRYEYISELKANDRLMIHPATYLDERAMRQNANAIEYFLHKRFTDEMMTVREEIEEIDFDTVDEEVEKEMDDRLQRMQPFMDASMKQVSIKVLGANHNHKTLKERYGEVWTEAEAEETFEVRLLPGTPFLAAKRKDDGTCGILLFQHLPRFYFGFMEEEGVSDLFYDE